MRLKKSPLARDFPAMPPLAGVRVGGIASGAKYRGRDDLMLAEFAGGATLAGVFAQSAVPGAPLLWCRQHFAQTPRALLVNAGQANVCTGDAGLAHVRATCDAVAKQLHCDAEQVLAASTGVIGEPLAAGKIISAVPQLIAKLRADAWEEAVAAIATTDTFNKGACARAEIENCAVQINGIAKGSGMIAPNMATMLAFIFTDASLPQVTLQKLLVEINEETFNAVSVDGDSSTSDMCLLFATAAAGNARARTAAALASFKESLHAVMRELALQVAADGEGAQKLICVEVEGAADARAAKVIARAIAESPLVKTAIAGEDANWGRLAMAAGKSGERVDAARLEISIGGVTVARNGARVDGLDETPVTAHLRGREISLRVDAGVGAGRARMWTCDFTRGYIDINASYRS